ncbi:MAG: hypothetical protein AAFQ07_05895 [Chloroflexota bacterium]
MTLLYRIQQGVDALLAFTQAVDYDLVSQHLTNTQMTLFKQMAKSDQLHSVSVLRDVLAQADETPHDLAVAALLHDCGKARKHLSVWERTVSVIIATVFKRLDDHLSVDDIGEGEVRTWRAPFIVRRHHPAWGGTLLTSAGASERAIWLVTHHADDEVSWLEHAYHDLLVRLQIADDAN